MKKKREKHSRVIGEEFLRIMFQPRKKDEKDWSRDPRNFERNPNH